MMLAVAPGEATDLLASVLRSTLDGILVVDRAGRVVAWNQRFLRLWRVPDGAARSAPRMLRHALRQLADRHRHAARARALATDPGAAAHTLLECLDGRTFELFAEPHRVNGQVVGRVWSFGDLTESRLAERVLRESEERYALALRGANDGLWDWRRGSGELFVSARWCEIVGLPAMDRVIRISEWLGRVHPADRARVRLGLAAHLVGTPAQLEVEYRIRHQDGGWRWVLLRGAAVRGPSGRAVRMAGSQTDVTARKAADEARSRDAVHDPLTGLPNRTLLADRLELALRRARSGRERTAGGPRHVGVLAVDLDGFGEVVHALGQPAADAVLVEAAGRLQRFLRPGDTVARLGDDQFVVLVEDLARPDDALLLAERLQSALRVAFQRDREPVYLTASIGIAVSDRGGGAERLLADAWTALRRARAGGRGRHELCDREMQERAAVRRSMQAELRGALEHGRVEVHYQPVVALEDGAIHGFEALARLRARDGSVLLPAEFIPLAEEAGLIDELGLRVLRAACEQMGEWERAHPSSPGRRVSVNLSPAQLAAPGLARHVADALADAGLAPRALRLELTETVLAGDVDAVTGVLDALKRTGVSLAIDDFGTGYSSLAYLHRFPLDALKVDRSFVARLGEGGGEEIVRTIVSLARSLGLETIAEGVETEDQRVRLLSLGCTLAQGYLFAPPLPAASAGRLLARSRALAVGERRVTG